MCKEVYKITDRIDDEEYCIKCHKTKKITQFYKQHGYTQCGFRICKTCVDDKEEYQLSKMKLLKSIAKPVPIEQLSTYRVRCSNCYTPVLKSNIKKHMKTKFCKTFTKNGRTECSCGKFIKDSSYNSHMKSTFHKIYKNKGHIFKVLTPQC